MNLVRIDTLTFLLDPGGRVGLLFFWGGGDLMNLYCWFLHEESQLKHINLASFL